LPALQAMQPAPFVPHAPLAVPGWQVPLASQQPLGQLLALQASSSSSGGDTSSSVVSLSSSSGVGDPSSSVVSLSLSSLSSSACWLLALLLVLPQDATTPTIKPSKSARPISEKILAFMSSSSIGRTGWN